MSFNIPTTFAAIPIGGEFIEAMTTCNEVAIRTESRVHQGKLVNAWRSGGKLIFMAEWEPVFVKETKEQRLHNDLRDIWTLVTARPGITLRAIASALGCSTTKAYKLVNMLLASGTLAQDVSNERRRTKSLHATVPMIPIIRK